MRSRDDDGKETRIGRVLNAAHGNVVVIAAKLVGPEDPESIEKKQVIRARRADFFSQGTKALLSPATQFLFKLIDTFSATFSTLDPVKAKGRTFVRDSA